MRSVSPVIRVDVGDVDVGDVVAVGLVVVIVNGRHIERGRQCTRLQLSHQPPPHTRSHGRTIAISSQSSGQNWKIR